MSKEILLDEFYQSGRHFIRMPSSQEELAVPISTEDPIIDWVIFYCPPDALKSWSVNTDEVDRWSASLARGFVPEGYDDMYNFVFDLKGRMGHKYDIANNEIRKAQKRRSY